MSAYIKAEGDKQVPPTADAETGLEESDTTETPPEKQPRLFSHYKKTPSSAEKPSVQAQLTAYLHLIGEENFTSIPCLKFWQQNKSKFPALFHIATQVFSIPASSAPIERVFSQGGILMRPHRARLGSAMVSDLIYLKCNMSV